MSDRIAVMNHGKVEQLDSAARVFEQPRTEFVAHFMGASNFFEASIQALADGLLSISLLPGHEMKIKAEDLPAPAESLAGTEAMRFVVRPEKLDLRGRDLSAHGIPSLPVTIEDRVYQGISTVWIVRDARENRYVIYEQNERPFEERGKFEVGHQAYLCWNPKHTVVISENGTPAEGRAQ